MNHQNRLGLYTSTAQASSLPVLERYSRSFSLTSRLYPQELRRSIACIYALVRVADEIVDGTARDAGLNTTQQAQILNDLEHEVENALETGFSANLVVHAFAHEARRAHITAELTRPFFASMRMDLEPVDFTTPQEYRSYIHGSAEVIGLMCLKIFLKNYSVTEFNRYRMEKSACALGAAFQKTNFLRDYCYDRENLSRNYFPHVRGELTDVQRNHIIADIQDDLEVAREGIPLLPLKARIAVRGATALFEHLVAELASLPLQQLLQGRISLRTTTKTRILAQEFLKR